MSDQAGIELVPYEAYEVSPGVWGIRCGDTTVEIPEAPLRRYPQMRQLADRLNAAARKRYLPESAEEWDRWWHIQYAACEAIGKLIGDRSQDQGDIFGAALCASVIEHVAEMQRRYLHLPPRPE